MLEPTLHSVSVCPLSAVRTGGGLVCRTRAFVAPRGRIFYVTPGDAFLWLAASFEDAGDGPDPAACAAALQQPGPESSFRSVLYRIPVSGADPSVLGVCGGGYDQFSYDVHDGRFRGLLGWFPERCGEDIARRHRRHDLGLIDVVLTRFDTVLREAPASSYTPLPPVVGDWLVNRITETHLVYGELLAQRDKDDRWQPLPTSIVAVDLARPRQPAMLRLPHNIRRAERAGNDVLLTGYRPGEPGLDVSLVDLDGGPRVASTVTLSGRFESEGRSHAFNHLLARDGSGTMALPTIRRRARKEHGHFWSHPSDLSFLVADPAGNLAPAGRLASSLPVLDRDRRHPDGEPDEDMIPGYSCEVSCTDWYGNSRPIFTGARIFALTGAELIEGRFENGRIVEIGRLDFARTPPRSRR